MNIDFCEAARSAWSHLTRSSFLITVFTVNSRIFCTGAKLKKAKPALSGGDDVM
jgi:hypothetical protein